MADFELLAKQPTPRFGVYVHFPFCRARCPYCDFATDVRTPIPHDAYADAIVRELELRAPMFDGRRARTLYVGGGTPGLWHPQAFERVARAIERRFGSPDEIAIEVNPGECDAEVLAAFAQAGVTRVSLGVQSLDDATLRALGRLHGAAEGITAYRDARAAGFASISCDVIFGAPGQTAEKFLDDLTGIVALAPDHVSLYGMTVEAGTPFGQLRVAGRLQVPDSDSQADMYEAAIDRLAAAGYEHYEVSNFARPGHHSRHNMIYWTGGEYLGLGVSAHSRRLLGAESDESAESERFANPAHLEAYLASIGQNAMHERLDADATRRESIWLALRLRRGVERSRVREVPPELLAQGLVEEVGSYLRLTRRGLLLGDQVSANFL